MVKYLVIDQHINENVDEFVDVYNTVKEAHEAAQSGWGNLASAEKKQRRIFVAFVEDTKEYLNDWAFEEDGKVDFTGYHSYGRPEGAFDSAVAFADDYATANGTAYRNETIAEHMDDEIRERLNVELLPCTAQVFVDAYCAAHLAKFDEEFVID